MGFWHTGYIEFHEQVGLDGYDTISQKVYYCQHCCQAFPSVTELRRHRFETHPYNRPILFVKGIEVGSTPLRVTRPLLTGDIQVDRCTRALINGEPVSILELDAKLASLMRDTITIELVGEHVSALFTLRFEIASAIDLKSVDHCFLNVAHGRRLDMRAIEQFIQASKPYRSAIGYCDGICEYLYGVLAKERAPGSTLPYESYREKFTRAADEVKDFDRPLARMIGALIAFHFNHFAEAVDLAGTSRLGIVSKRFAQWIAADNGGIGSARVVDLDSSLETLVTDLETEQIIRWGVMNSADLVAHKSEMVSLLHQDIPEFDRAKLHLLLGQLALEQGDLKEALRYSREFRNSATLGRWAEHVIKACKKLE